VHRNGDKLSKLTGAAGLSMEEPERGLLTALQALHQHPPPELAEADLASIWAWATKHWAIRKLRGLTAIQADEQALAELENPLR